MKFRATFKTPDALRSPTQTTAQSLVRDKIECGNLTYEQFDDEVNESWHQLMQFARKWVRYGEYVTIEFDTEAGTAVVIPLEQKMS